MKQSISGPVTSGRKRKGMALVMVLVIVALLMGLVLAMLSMGSSEARSSSAFSQTHQARSLGDMPSTIVMGQIREATSKLEMSHTWASQPGMIRRFGTDAADTPGRAALEKVWRLYSSPKMTEEGKGFDATREADTLATWSANPALFTDLNEPVATIRADGTVKQVYPILDENALRTQVKVEGFGLSSSSGAPGTSDLHPLPMPVSWLYVLQDGKMVSPASGSGTKAKFNSGEVTKDNPIVGRIAFWTDDETCKVNINTASEGTSWDVPRTKSWTDRNYALQPPAYNEFQRFPGHPAMTCLSTVLQAFDIKYEYQFPRTQSDGSVSNKDTYQAWLKDIYALLPRTNLGTADVSSLGGTSVYQSQAGIPLKRQRLFSSVDEFFYGTDFIEGSRQRQPNTSTGRIDAQDLEMARFFLTAHSRAPEVNLYNRPRVSLWPVQAEPAKRTAKDKLMIHCATSANILAAMQRATGWDKKSSETKPWSAQSPTQDFQLSANQTVFGYLQKLTKAGAPGFGNSCFDDKYGALNRNQILLGMFDLIRVGVNARNTREAPEYFYLAPDNYSGEPNGQGSATPIVSDGTATEQFNHKLKAFGRFPTVVEACVVFMATEIKYKDSQKTIPLPPSDGDLKGAVANKMRAFLILQPFTPVAGLPSYTPVLRYRIKGLQNWQVNGQSLGFPDDGVNRVWEKGGRDLGRATPYSGVNDQFHAKDSAPGGGGNETTTYPFVSQEIDLSTTTKETFSFTGGPITIETHIATGNGSALGDSTLIQTSTMDFPSASAWPSPTIRWDDKSKLPNQKDMKDAQNFMSLQKRLAEKDKYEYIICKGDIARSVVVAATQESISRGDYRILCGMREIPASAFRAHPDYASGTKMEAQSLRYGGDTYPGHFGRTHGQPYHRALFGKQHVWQIAGYKFDADKKISKSYGLLQDVAYWDECQPNGPIELDGAFNALGKPGDWDTGTGGLEDGPYINKPYDAGKGADILDSRLASQNYEHASAFSPNQQICSAVAFGSLPSGIHPTSELGGTVHPWQTLLFCPNPPSRATAPGQEPTETDHWGFKPPRDHLFLDLFWVPVVEPYAISEPLSTAGKVNLNTQIMPFSYIRRDTGLCAAMRSLRINALPTKLAMESNACYKGKMPYETAHEVNLEETLKGLYRRFNQGDIYRSASEICDLFLVPKRLPGRDYTSPDGGGGGADPMIDQMVSWWNGSLTNQKDAHELTGDNVRESPYNQIYSRLTTKSNSFTVHHRVQVLKKTRSTSVDEWDEDKDSMVAESRGSTLIERYIDPNAPDIPDFIANPTQKGALDDHYRFRVIMERNFAP